MLSFLLCNLLDFFLVCGGFFYLFKVFFDIEVVFYFEYCYIFLVEIL